MSAVTGESAPVVRSAGNGAVGATPRPVRRRPRRRALRHHVHIGRSARSGGPHGHVHGAGQDRHPQRPSAHREQSAGATGTPGGVADRRRGHRGRPRLPAPRRRRRVVLDRRRRLRHRAAGGQRARGPAADHHPRPGGRRGRARPPRRPGQAAGRDRDPRQHRRHLHRQDRNPDPEPDALAQRLGLDGPSPAVAGAASRDRHRPGDLQHGGPRDRLRGPDGAGPALRGQGLDVVPGVRREPPPGRGPRPKTAATASSASTRACD